MSTFSIMLISWHSDVLGRHVRNHPQVAVSLQTATTTTTVNVNTEGPSQSADEPRHAYIEDAPSVSLREREEAEAPREIGSPTSTQAHRRLSVHQTAPSSQRHASEGQGHHPSSEFPPQQIAIPAPLAKLPQPVSCVGSEAVSANPTIQLDTTSVSLDSGSKIHQPVQLPGHALDAFTDTSAHESFQCLTPFSNADHFLWNFPNGQDLPSAANCSITDNMVDGQLYSEDILQSWFVQPEPDHVNSAAMQNLLHKHQGLLSRGSQAMPTLPEKESSNTGETAETIPRFPREGFSRLDQCWVPRSRRHLRLMPNVWREVVDSHRDNLFCDLPIEKPATETKERRLIRWGFDESCRHRIETAINQTVTPPTSGSSPVPPATYSIFGDSASMSASSPVTNTNRSRIAPGHIKAPQAEIFDISLDLYESQFHPTLPFMHLATFSAKAAPTSLLLVMTLLGFSILGTTGAARFVSLSFPVSSFSSSLTHPSTKWSQTPAPYPDG